MKKRTVSDTLNKVGIAAIIIGLILILYPLGTNIYSWYESRNIEESYIQEPEEVEEQSLEGIKPSPEEGEDSQSDEAMAILEIPALELITPVLRGTSQKILAKAPGWYEQSALPGEGNTAIAGHRTMYGGEFRDLHSLKDGEMIKVSYEGHIYEYEVEEIFTVASNDWSIIDPCGYSALTLTTCHPDGRSKRRILRARQVSANESGEQNGEIEDVNS